MERVVEKELERGMLSRRRASICDTLAAAIYLPILHLDSAIRTRSLKASIRYSPSTGEGARYDACQGNLAYQNFRGAAWVTKTDRVSIPFYQASTDSTRTKARCAALLVGNGEVSRLGERHSRPANLSEASKEHEIPAKPYA